MLVIFKCSSCCCPVKCGNNILAGANPREGGTTAVYAYRTTIFISILSMITLGIMTLINARGFLIQGFDQARNVMGVSYFNLFLLFKLLYRI